MKKTFLLMAGTLLLTGVSVPVMAQEDNSIIEATKEIIDEVIEETTEILTGEENEPKGKEGKSGNENALDQIDKNLEKHGGEHKGLENAHDAVSGNKGHGNKGGSAEDDSTGIIEEIADDIKEEIEDTSDAIFEGDKPSEGKGAKGGKPAGAGHKGKEGKGKP